jgi:hypothetical protein
MVRGRAVLAAQVVTFDMSRSGAVMGVWGRAAECTDGEGRKLESRELAEWNDMAGPQVGADGSGVVMGCDERLARGGGARHTIGAVWFGANRTCRRAFRDAQVCCWWAGRPRRLSRSCHKRRETWWDVGRYV